MSSLSTDNLYVGQLVLVRELTSNQHYVCTTCTLNLVEVYWWIIGVIIAKHIWEIELMNQALTDKRYIPLKPPFLLATFMDLPLLHHPF